MASNVQNPRVVSVIARWKAVHFAPDLTVGETAKSSDDDGCAVEDAPLWEPAARPLLWRRLFSFFSFFPLYFSRRFSFGLRELPSLLFFFYFTDSRLFVFWRFQVRVNLLWSSRPRDQCTIKMMGSRIPRWWIPMTAFLEREMWWAATVVSPGQGSQCWRLMRNLIPHQSLILYIPSDVDWIVAATLVKCIHVKTNSDRIDEQTCSRHWIGDRYRLHIFILSFLLLFYLYLSLFILYFDIPPARAISIKDELKKSNRSSHMEPCKVFVFPILSVFSLILSSSVRSL